MSKIIHCKSGNLRIGKLSLKKQENLYEIKNKKFIQAFEKQK